MRILDLKSLDEALPEPPPEDQPGEQAPDVDVPPEAIKQKLSDDEIHQLINDNVKLAYWFANKYSNVNADKADIEGQALAGLVKAANMYDPSKGAFSSYASMAIRNYLGHIYHVQGRHYGLQSTTLDEPAHGGDEGGDETRKDTVAAEPPEDDYEATVQSEARTVVQDVMDKVLNPQEREILNRWLAGESYRDMQASFNLSFQTIGNYNRAAIEKVKAELKERGISGIKSLVPESNGASFNELLLLEVCNHILLQRLPDEERNSLTEKLLDYSDRQGGHGVVKCSCGKLISQCRCSTHKKVTVVENGCDDCKK